ncbi:hypothetical protein [Flammeovirga sp. SubArs3]|uniref:hypothetical protein n=1 Tax=Flammeovirga sp. SubArs3 TaxID=2995316 RepID=UPI00248AE2FB|nr:hypothetical protein [Flammeovirga sp. SubArs3]
MNTLSKFIIVSIFSLFAVSCASEGNIIPELNPANNASDAPAALLDVEAFLQINMQPVEGSCEEPLSVNLLNSNGLDFMTTVSPIDGVYHLSYDEELSYGPYSVKFYHPQTGEVVGSTSFYITSEDLDQENYIKDFTYDACPQ